MAFALPISAGAMGAGCNPSPDTSTCFKGDYQTCTCDGDKGYQRCGDDGAFGQCDCSGTPGNDAGPPSAFTTSGAGGGGGGAGGGASGPCSTMPLAFLCPCVNDSDCESKLCFHFNAKGPHCSIPCTPATFCPPPSDGCSGMNVCKSP